MASADGGRVVEGQDTAARENGVCESRERSRLQTVGIEVEDDGTTQDRRPTEGEEMADRDGPGSCAGRAASTTDSGRCTGCRRAIGYEGRLEYSAIGTVVNLAARLCGGAGDSQILISSRVLSKIENGIDVESLGELALKGFNRPIPAYNVLTERPEA